MHASELIYDWNLRSKKDCQFPSKIEICDETLRDGIQSPSVYDPKIDDKLELITLMEELGITIANIGLPCAGPRAYAHVLRIAKFVRDHHLKLQLNCAARTLKEDIKPIAEIQHIVGIPILAYCFLGTSPIRQIVEEWSLDKLKKTTEEAISFALKENIKVAFVTEDTIRSLPKTLEILFNHAIDLGIERLVLCDTVGHATPAGIKALVDFTKDLIAKSKKDIKIDWHGHNDRGLAVSNALFAAKYGCHRIHATALGIGERIGNTAIDQLIVNLKLLNCYPHVVSSLKRYVEKAASFCQIPLPKNYPIFGSDAFRTATGVHAAAVIKAKRKGNEMLADIIYSGVPAHWFGKKQIIEIGPMSGASNVRHWLSENKIEITEKLVRAVLDLAKNQSRILNHQELMDFINERLRSENFIKIT
jgi:2-isopropylmalate synthase